MKSVNLLDQKGPQGYLFLMNLDGLLTNSLFAHYTSWQEQLKEINIDLNQTQFYKLQGLRDAEFLNHLLKSSKISLPISDRDEIIIKKNQKYLHNIRYLNEDDLLPGVRNFLVGAKRIQIPIVIISENVNAHFVIEQTGLKPMIQLVMDGNHASPPKPDPSIYLTVAERFKYPVKQCIVFENSQLGLEAAIRAKMKIVCIGDFEKFQDADQVFPDFKRIKAYEVINWFRIM